MHRRTLALLLILLFILIGLGVYFKLDAISAFDTGLRALIKTLHSSQNTSFFAFVTRLGDAGTVATAGLIAAAFLFFQKRVRSAIAILALPAVTFVIVEGIKSIVDRTRPTASLITEQGASFPSGHATIAAVFFASLYFTFIAQNPSRAKRIVSGIILTIITLLIAFSRIYLGVHFPTDVLAGLFLGFGIALFGERYLA